LEAESSVGPGVADPLVPGVGVALPVGLPVRGSAGVGVSDVGEEVAVDVDVTGDGDCDVLP
jgi:hypothetical protein